MTIYKMKLLDSKIIGKKLWFQVSLICGSPGGRLVSVAAPSGVVAGRTARSAATSAAASSEASASTVAAGSPAAIAAAAAIVLRPTAAILAEAWVASSHFPVRAAVGWAAGVARWPSVATVERAAAAALAPAPLAIRAVPAAEPVAQPVAPEYLRKPCMHLCICTYHKHFFATFKDDLIEMSSYF
jgi:hypothetical protein